MSEYVRMPKAHYEAACNSIRAKTGKTDLIKSGGMSAEIDSIASGGGSSDDVRYVTFMSYDGLTEIGKLPVATGYDCPAPKFTATRESTAQYSYTQDGWSTTANGGLDSNALKEVNEDRTVYAHFKATVRKYTITYLDDDGSALETKTFAYGSMPEHTVEKDGYDFVGWQPELTAVTGDAIYTAKWKEKVGFAIATWAEISEITTAGTTASFFAVGDTKSDVLTYSDGTTEEIEWVISKIRDDGTMVLAFNYALENLKPMHSSTIVAANYLNNSLGQYIDNTVIPALSEEISAVIRPVEILWGMTKLLRLPTNGNMLGTSTSTDPQSEGLPLFATQANRIRTRKTDGSAVQYWLNYWKQNSSNYYCFQYVNEDGSISNYSGADHHTTNKGVVLLCDV